MKTLNRPPESLAGNLELYFTPVSNIANFQDHTIEVTNEDLLVKVICTPETIKHLQTATKTASGMMITHKITANTYGWSEENDALLLQLSKYKLYVVIRDSYGNYYGVGTSELGLTLTWEHDSGSDGSGVKGYELTLQGNLITTTTPMEFNY